MTWLSATPYMLIAALSGSLYFLFTEYSDSQKEVGELSKTIEERDIAIKILNEQILKQEASAKVTDEVIEKESKLRKDAEQNLNDTRAVVNKLVKENKLLKQRGSDNANVEEYGDLELADDVKRLLKQSTCRANPSHSDCSS